MSILFGTLTSALAKNRFGRKHNQFSTLMKDDIVTYGDHEGCILKKFSALMKRSLKKAQNIICSKRPEDESNHPSQGHGMGHETAELPGQHRAKSRYLSHDGTNWTGVKENKRDFRLGSQICIRKRINRKANTEFSLPVTFRRNCSRVKLIQRI